MNSPKLVILTGYPTCGKSTISKYLANDMGYSRLSGDEISIELFGHTYPYKENEDPERIWETIYKRRDDLLKQGKNVVIDTTAYNEERRKKLFNTGIEADKYLVWIQANPETMNNRQEERKWTADSIDMWKRYVGWEDPENDPNDYKILIYQNNSKEDLERIKGDLKQKLS